MLCFFFFSSRRRHTRWNCDWSSDVCSSDLPSSRMGRMMATCPGYRSVLYSIVRILPAHAHGMVEMPPPVWNASSRSEEHTSELQSQFHLVCRLLLEKKKRKDRL